MSRCWKKYGEPVMEVLINFDSEQEMLEYEQVLITKFIEEEFCLNLNPFASKPPSSKGKPMSEKHKAKLSAVKKGRIQEAANKARRKPIQVGDIIYVSFKDAANALGVVPSVFGQALKKNYKVKGLEVRRIENGQV